MIDFGMRDLRLGAYVQAWVTSPPVRRNSMDPNTGADRWALAAMRPEAAPSAEMTCQATGDAAAWAAAWAELDLVWFAG